MEKETENIMKDVEKMMKAQQEGYDAVITGIEKTDSHTFYKTDQFDNREGYLITVEIDSKNGDTWTEFYAIPKNRGFAGSLLGAFCRKYNSVPKINMKVKAEITENGFLRIVV